MVSAWTVLVPLKSLAAAKSRLRGAVSGMRHEDLVLAMAHSTVEAASASPLVRQLIVVTECDTSLGELTQGSRRDLSCSFEPGDLNACIRAAAVGLTGPLAVLPADLPALWTEELSQALEMATQRSFVPDAEGTGTVLLAAPFGDLDPHFGTDSAAAHELSGAVRLECDWPGLRRDVDTAADLAAVRALGWTYAGHRLRV